MVIRKLKEQIEGIVKEYIQVFPEEYAYFRRAMSQKQSNLRTKYAETLGMDTVYRQISEIPETLWLMVYKRVTEEEMEWFKSEKGQKWFVKKYPQFLTGEKL